MKTYISKKMEPLIGRDSEIEQLKEISRSGAAAILVVYGRRRVGKTALLEQTFKDRNLLKFEGIESKSDDEQRQAVTTQLAEYAEEPLLNEIIPKTWTEVFKLIHRYTKGGQWTIYFEELQWLANYKPDFVSELKFYWDNYFSHNPELLMILCGSSPSFMIKQVMHSKALHNRSQYEIKLEPLNVQSARKLLGKNRSSREVMDAYLCVGGIPEYLNRIKNFSSLYLGICTNAFKPKGYFLNEFERIFVSSFAQNRDYRTIIKFLSTERYATRAQILKKLGKKSGGNLTELLQDLAICDFIKKYSSIGTGQGLRSSRYQISDSYLNFYYHFIEILRERIDDGDFQEGPTKAIRHETYLKWLGLAFERYCRKNANLTAKILGFSAVQFTYGALYPSAQVRSVNDSLQAQVDLVFDRQDRVLTVCEVKYTDEPVGNEVVSPFEKKLALVKQRYGDTKSIHKVLISAAGINQALKNSYYFDQVITLDEFMGQGG